MNPTRRRLGELLIAHRLVTPEQVNEALSIQRLAPKPLGQILVQKGFITEDRLLQACAAQKGVAAWFLQRDAPVAQALALVPGNICITNQLLPVQQRGDRLIVAMREPGDIDAIDMLRNLTHLRIEPVLANEDRLLQMIDDIHGASASPKEDDAMSRLVTSALDEFAGDDQAEAAVSEAELRPVVAVVNQILMEAIRRKASDIHIEPRKERIEVRYRVDGQLQRVHDLPVKLKAALTARIKIIGSMDIVEYRIPQDGRIAVTADGRTIDFRVSILPSYHGQRIVMRVLDKSMTLRHLTDLGLSERNMVLFDNMIHQPYGIVLVTGPTGSGKTTTLYAAVNALKEVANNIMTCEDPVEYDIDGINQSQINEKVGLTFAAQLRAILRQDPDIVLVGEIRDRETAETALRAALTGHLVLSTLHSNDAPSALPRLLDMGIEPFLLSTALNGIVSQRLVRILCSQCKEHYAPSAEERALLEPMFEKDVPVLWKPVGCAACGDAGYKGRMAIHEVFPTPHEVQRAIAAGEPLETLRQLAFRLNYRPMQYDAAERVLLGLTSLAEVRRLVAFDAPSRAMMDALPDALPGDHPQGLSLIKTA